MDPDYYLRQAKQERGHLERYEKAQNKATEAINKATTAAETAAAAAQASSPSKAKSKLNDAKRERGKAKSARNDHTRASKNITASKAKISKFEENAREAQRKLDKKATDAAEKAKKERERQAARDEREAKRKEREAKRRDELVSTSIDDLGERTGELERRLVAARRAAPETITVLFIAGTIVTGDEDKKPLRLDREIHEIDQKLRASTYRDQVTFRAAHATQIADFIDLLNQHDPDIVHFSGHGNESSLLFEGPDGQPEPLRGEELALFLRAARKPIQLIVFNACLSADLAEAATEHVSAAIGMDETIRDDSAKTFAGQFYGSLAEGNSLQNAFEQGQAQANVVNDDPESGMSMLFAKPGVDPETLVLVAPPD